MLLLIAAVGGVTLATRRAAPRGADEPGAFEVERPERVPQPAVVGDGGRDAVRDRAHRRRGGPDAEKADG